MEKPTVVDVCDVPEKLTVPGAPVRLPGTSWATFKGPAFDAEYVPAKRKDKAPRACTAAISASPTLVALLIVICVGAGFAIGIVLMPLIRGEHEESLERPEVLSKRPTLVEPLPDGEGCQIEGAAEDPACKLRVGPRRLTNTGVASTTSSSSFKSGLKEALESMLKNDPMAKAGKYYGAAGIVTRGSETVSFQWGANPLAEDGNQVIPAISEDSMMSLASSSKVQTQVALLKLWEESFVQLDDPLSEYLPEFRQPDGTPIEFQVIRTPTAITKAKGGWKVVDGQYVEAGKSYPVESIDVGGVSLPYALVPAARPPTVRDALSMSTGLAESFIGWVIQMFEELPAGFVPGTFTGSDNSIFAKYSIYNSLLGIPRHHFRPANEAGVLTRARQYIEFAAQGGFLVQQPGSQFEYGMDNSICARVVEEAFAMKKGYASGSPAARLQNALQELVWDPLGMDNSFFYLDPSQPRFTERKEFAEKHICPVVHPNASRDSFSPDHTPYAKSWELSPPVVGAGMPCLLSPGYAAIPLAPVMEHSAGCVFGTVKDVHKISSMIMRHGKYPDGPLAGTSYLQRSTIALAMTFQSFDITQYSEQYALAGPSYVAVVEQIAGWGLLGQVNTPTTTGAMFTKNPDLAPFIGETTKGSLLVEGFPLLAKSPGVGITNSIHTTRWGGFTGNAWTANLADDVSHTLFTFNEAQGEYGTRVINEKVLKIIHEYML